MQDAMRIPPEHFKYAAASSTHLPGARAKIGKGKREAATAQRAPLLNAYQTHHSINQAKRRALQPMDGGLCQQSNRNCRDMVHGLHEMQKQPDHRHSLSDAKRQAAYLDNMLQNLDDERAISPTVDHFINSVYGRPAATPTVPPENAGASLQSPTACSGTWRRANEKLEARVPWRAPKFFR